MASSYKQSLQRLEPERLVADVMREHAEAERAARQQRIFVARLQLANVLAIGKGLAEGVAPSRDIFGLRRGARQPWHRSAARRQAVSDTNEKTVDNSVSSLSKTAVLRRARNYAERVVTAIDAGRCDALADLMAARALLLLATSQSIDAKTPGLNEATAAVAHARTRYLACYVRYLPRDGARA